MKCKKIIDCAFMLKPNKRNICRLRSRGCAATIFIAFIFGLYTVQQNICKFVNLSPCCAKEAIVMKPRSGSNVTMNGPLKNINFRLNSNQCQGRTKWLVIGVISDVRNFKRREIVRRTWGSVLRRKSAPAMALVFIVGEKQTFNKSLRQALEMENVQNQDIVQINTEDSYTNLVLKSIAFLKWTTQHCHGFKHLLKVDDDIFVNMHTLIKVVKMVQAEPKFIMGQVLRDSKPSRNIQSKHYVSVTDYPAAYYPTYVTGAGYVMSSKMAREVGDVVDLTPLVAVEDIFITGLCAKRVGGVYIGDCGFSYHSLPLNEVTNYPNRVTFHGFKVDQFYSLWKQMDVSNTLSKF